MTRELFNQCTDDEKWTAMQLLAKRDDAMADLLYSLKEAEDALKRVVSASTAIAQNERSFTSATTRYLEFEQAVGSRTVANVSEQ